MVDVKRPGAIFLGMKHHLPDLSSREKLQLRKAFVRDVLVNVFGGQMQAARALKFHDRTVRWWCQYGAPDHVLSVLERVQNGEISIAWARHLLRTKRSRRRKRKANGRNRSRA